MLWLRRDLHQPPWCHGQVPNACLGRRLQDHELFVGHKGFRVPTDRAQTAAERTLTLSQIVETLTLSDGPGSDTALEMYKLAKELGMGDHMLRTVGISVMHLSTMGTQQDRIDEQRRQLNKEVRQADQQRIGMKMFTRFAAAMTTVLTCNILRLAAFDVIPCLVKEHLISAWHVAFNRYHLTLVLAEREWSGEPTLAYTTQPEQPEKDLWYDALLVMDEKWIPPYTKHRVMMASWASQDRWTGWPSKSWGGRTGRRGSNSCSANTGPKISSDFKDTSSGCRTTPGWGHARMQAIWPCSGVGWAGLCHLPHHEGHPVGGLSGGPRPRLGTRGHWLGTKGHWLGAKGR